MYRLQVLRFVLPLLLASAALRAQDLPVYDDTLQSGFEDYSYGGGTDLSATTPVHGGTKSISFTGNNYNAVSFAHTTQDFSAAQYPTLRFWVHGGATGGQQLRVYLQLNGGVVANAELDTYISGGAVAAGSWREVTVVLGQAPLSYSGSFDRIDVQSDMGAAQPVLYLDDVGLVAIGSPPPANALQIEHGVTVSSMLSDRFTWTDSAGKPRVAALAHNDTGAGPGGVRGGALREFQYRMPDNSTRTAGVTNYGNGGNAGFGYVVSHASNSSCIGDDSPLGGYFAGTWQRVFEGRHHAVFRFTQNYPRNCSTTLPVVARTVPVTIDWVFSTGRDNPLWAVTWDLSGVPVNTFWDDSRAPYGELNIDGTGAEDISGVAWGDRYRFTSTTAPVTLDSSWTWNVTNTVPYVKLWIGSTNATMGLVQTQPNAQQDAGGGRNPFYHDVTPYWGKTSANGNAGGANVMPWQDSWPYQANAFSIGPAPNSNNNARLTWGTQYGFLGQQAYQLYDGSGNTAPGWPKKSYSVYVVLGPHSAGPVETQVAQVETIQSLSLSATIGSVVTSGPAGVARADNVTLAPAGHNHVYGALAFNARASDNRLDANVGVGSGTLKKPLVIVGAYTGSWPVVKLGGATLTQDADYYPSLRAASSELWVTLNRNLTGATNHLEINPSGGPPPPAPSITPSGPTTFCAGGSVTLTASISPGAGVSYLWSPGGQTTQAIVVTASGSYAVTVAVNGDSGTSPSTVVTVNPIPATPVITAPPAASPGATGLTASVPFHAGSGYSWSITNGTITSGTTGNQVSFTAGALGSLTLLVTETSAAGCPSSQGSTSVNVVPAGSGTRFHTLAPCRVFDTRDATGPAAGAPALAAGETRTLSPAGRCGIPGTARSLSVNVTVTQPAGTGDLLLYPANLPTAPVASTISFRPGKTRANNTLLLLASNGTGFKVHNFSAGTVHFILDVSGWFE
jgi:hypothetical protein